MMEHEDAVDDALPFPTWGDGDPSARGDSHLNGEGHSSEPVERHVESGDGGGVGWWVAAILGSLVVGILIAMFSERRNELTRADVEAISRAIIDDKLGATTARVEGVTTRLEGVSNKVDAVVRDLAELGGQLKGVLQADAPLSPRRPR